MKEATLPVLFEPWPIVYPFRPERLLVPPADVPSVQEALSPEALDAVGPMLVIAGRRLPASSGRAIEDVREIGLLVRIDLKIETGDIVQIDVRGRRRVQIRATVVDGAVTRARVGIFDPDGPLSDGAAELLRSWIHLRADDLERCIAFYDGRHREPFAPLPSFDDPDGELVDCLGQLFAPGLNPDGTEHAALFGEVDPDRRALLLVRAVEDKLR